MAFDINMIKSLGLSYYIPNFKIPFTLNDNNIDKLFKEPKSNRPLRHLYI